MPQPGWVTKVMGSAGELFSRSVRISNRKLREAGGWTRRCPSIREGWPTTLAAMGSGKS